ncbi:MAG: histidine--tRNA ligase [Tepidanaerobacter acetatoxydans]|uniref:histidine--tRNA ligase n=1 Tax=Tepidanaerobacter TaxID=499228 RepID=UPI000A575DFF|nr:MULTISPECIES: histidine--tRNA ligase [Tepidanaerobacter]NLU11286.1 histidine--tRNA ligase [Tepidanaerobacter acetatoxydans]
MSKDIVKPSTLPGFLELLPQDQILFNEIKDSIRNTYEKHGFIPIDTPLIEKSEILLAKGGGETEKQIYRFTKGDTDMALRFDLTVPLARYVAQHFSELTFPFRRYHIGKVYRGEKSQRGRFREFYQCDVDIIGNGKLNVIYDAEILSIIYYTFKNLGFENFTIKINNRKILNGFFSSLGITNSVEVLRTIDKLEKIGEKGVIDELINLGLSRDAVTKILKFIQIRGNDEEKLQSLKSLNIESQIFQEGIKELITVTNYTKIFGVPEKNYTIDLTIARGLDYYTGTVYETFLDDYPEIGSVCSGGRYENLAEYYTTQKLPGVGVSIGLTRLFYQLKEAGLLENDTPSTFTKVLIIPMDESFNGYAIKIANTLRENNIISEVYFEDAKIGKKLNYANNLNIPYTIFIGEEEVKNQMVSLKNMKTGSQELVTIDDVIKTVK